MSTYRPPSQRSSKVPTPDYVSIKRALLCLSPRMINCMLFLGRNKVVTVTLSASPYLFHYLSDNALQWGTCMCNGTVERVSILPRSTLAREAN